MLPSEFPDFPTELRAKMLQFAQDSATAMASVLDNIICLACYYRGQPAVALCVAVPANEEQMHVIPLFIAVQPGEHVCTTKGVELQPVVLSVNAATHSTSAKYLN